MPSFENIKKLYEPHIIFKETAAKLKRCSKFGLLRYGTSQKVYTYILLGPPGCAQNIPPT